MIEAFQEFFDSRGEPMRIDREAGLIRGVKILGLVSRNGRTYLPDALARARALYEGAKVNVNHPKGNPSSPRDYRDRIGVIRNAHVRPSEGLFADFHFNPKHGLAEQLVWDATHATENVGFSHNIQARTSRRGDEVVVEAITRVLSVDLVADPATTRGLFESQGDSKEDGKESSRGDNEGGDEGNATTHAPSGNASNINNEAACEPSKPTTTADSVLAESLAIETDAPTDVVESNAPTLSIEILRRDYPEIVEALVADQEVALGDLRAEVERLTTLEAEHQRQRTIRRMLRESALPVPEALLEERYGGTCDEATAEPRTREHLRTITEASRGEASRLVGRRFIASLCDAADDATVCELIKERAALVQGLGEGSASGTIRPKSRDQYLASRTEPLDMKAFVAAIT